LASAGIFLKVKRVHLQLDKFMNALGGQIHDTKLRLGTNPGRFSSPEDSVWGGIATIHGTVEDMEARVRYQVLLDAR
jgi:hypothetical protein